MSRFSTRAVDGQGQWPTFSIPTEKIPGCIHVLGTNLVILVQIHYKSSCWQTKFPRILSQNGQIDEDQGQWSLYSIAAGSIPGCMFGANLVIPAKICDELSCGQTKVYGRTDGRRDGQRQAMTIPRWPERPRGNRCFIPHHSNIWPRKPKARPWLI